MQRTPPISPPPGTPLLSLPPEAIGSITAEARRQAEEERLRAERELAMRASLQEPVPVSGLQLVDFFSSLPAEGRPTVTLADRQVRADALPCIELVGRFYWLMAAQQARERMGLSGTLNSMARDLLSVGVGVMPPSAQQIARPMPTAAPPVPTRLRFLLPKPIDVTGHTVTLTPQGRLTTPSPQGAQAVVGVAEDVVQNALERVSQTTGITLEQLRDGRFDVDQLHALLDEVLLNSDNYITDGAQQVAPALTEALAQPGTPLLQQITPQQAETIVEQNLPPEQITAIAGAAAAAAAAATAAQAPPFRPSGARTPPAAGATTPQAVAGRPPSAPASPLYTLARNALATGGLPAATRQQPVPTLVPVNEKGVAELVHNIAKQIFQATIEESALRKHIRESLATMYEKAGTMIGTPQGQAQIEQSINDAFSASNLTRTQRRNFSAAVVDFVSRAAPPSDEETTSLVNALAGAIISAQQRVAAQEAAREARAEQQAAAQREEAQRAPAVTPRVTRRGAAAAPAAAAAARPPTPQPPSPAAVAEALNENSDGIIERSTNEIGTILSSNQGIAIMRAIVEGNGNRDARIFELASELAGAALQGTEDFFLGM